MILPPRTLTETATAALLALTGVAAAVLAWRMGVWTDGSPGAGLMPFLSGVLLALLSLASLTASAEPADTGSDRRRLSWYLVALVAFCAIPPFAGSVTGFTVALLLAMHFGEGRSWPNTVRLELFPA